MIDPTSWPSYLAEFHSMNPGITEDVLGRCTSHVGSPYAWLTENIVPSERVLDLACGSAPAKPPGALHWIGLDLSEAELDRVRGGGNSALIIGDATTLPIRDGTVDVVTCSMALMLVQPLDHALAEIHRVLVPGGRLMLLLPERRPLHLTDRIAYLRLFWAARSTTKFPPTALRGHAAGELTRHGLQVASDDSRRFDYLIHGPADADRFVDSWYLPGVPEQRRDAARKRARSMAPVSIGIPLRRLIARRPS